MKTTICIVISVLFLATLASSENSKQTAAVLEFDVRGRLADEEPEASNALAGVVEGVISRRLRIASGKTIHQDMKKYSLTPVTCFEDPEGVAAFGRRIHVDRVVLGRLSPLGEDYLLELRVVDTTREGWAEVRVRQCETLEQVPATIEALLTEMGLAATAARRQAEPDRRENPGAEILRLRRDLDLLREDLKKLRELVRALIPDPPEPPPVEENDERMINCVVQRVYGEKRNRVILSAGKNDRVKVGDRFTVYRGDEYVATVLIDELESEQCIGHSLPDVEKTPIQVGDKATNRF